MQVTHVHPEGFFVWSYLELNLFWKHKGPFTYDIIVMKELAHEHFKANKF